MRRRMDTSIHGRTDFLFRAIVYRSRSKTGWKDRSGNSLIQAVVVEESGTADGPHDPLLLFSCRIQAKFIGSFHKLPHWSFCDSIYCLITERGAPPTVETKYEFVHRDGILLFNAGYSCRNVWDVFPFKCLTARWIPN